jgi:hypothetical protein
MRRACHASSAHASTQRAAVNALRLLGAVLGRPQMRGNTHVLRSQLPPLLQPLLDLLRPPGCAHACTAC